VLLVPPADPRPVVSTERPALAPRLLTPSNSTSKHRGRAASSSSTESITPDHQEGRPDTRVRVMQRMKQHRGREYNVWRYVT
jgi:hypothetical protein